MGKGSKGKGGQQTQESVAQVDPTLRKESHHMVNLFKLLASQDPQIYKGNTVAAFTPQQEAAFQGGQSASRAFGMGAPQNTMDGMPAPTVGPGGVIGFNTGAMAEEAIAQNDPDYNSAMDVFRRKIGKTFKDRKPDTPGGGGGKKGGKK